MRIEQYSADVLLDHLRQHRIATMNELKEELGTSSDATVHRKLRALGYHTSYSHRGSFYALQGTPTFDAWGLWSYRSVWFSRRGTLLATAEDLVEESEAGYFDAELELLLHVEVKGALLRLVRRDRLGREKAAGRYLYTSARAARRREQVRARRVYEAESLPGGAIPHVDVLPDELKACIVLFFSMLDEKQRRLYAGLEALKVGHGGDQAIAELLGLDPGTVARGRRELLEGDVEPQRVRRKGAGRKRLEKKRRR
jgi:hypothetical protein